MGSLEINILVRNSSLGPGKFNLFLSDLDLSIIVPINSNIQLFEAISDAFLLWRRCFPFIGEIEIYTQVEISEIQNARKCIKFQDHVVRTIRKLRWMNESFARAQTPYHRYKARRAAAICCFKLGIPTSAEVVFENNIILPKISKFLTDWAYAVFPSELGEIKLKLDCEIHTDDIHVFSDYWGYHFSIRGGLQEIAVSDKSVLVLLTALVPDDYHGQNTWKAIVEITNDSVPQVKELRQSLALIECLTITAWARTLKFEPEWVRPWVQRLREISSKTPSSTAN